VRTYTSRRGARGWSPLLPLLAMVAVVLTLVGLSLYFRSYAPPPYYGAQYPGLWIGWPLFGVGWILIPLFFFGVFFALRWFFWGGWGWGRGWYGRYYDDPAIEVLRERFARGEITKEQFERMARDLQGR
jgi:putative membrane protein